DGPPGRARAGGTAGEDESEGDGANRGAAQGHGDLRCGADSMRPYTETMTAVIALQGPTNTGKTYHAVERLLAHRTGMIGFPLRLLARENYDRLVHLRGAEAVALITGEERIVPSSPRYFICTVEAMPLDRKVDFLAVDEIQLAADRERGHVFTDRLLGAR